MIWWFNYAPHFPLSGGVTQDIRPTLLARAGDADVEERVLRDVASYGRQIGALTDLLVGLAETLPAGTLKPEAARALAQLQDFQQQVESIKQRQQQLKAPG